MRTILFTNTGKSPVYKGGVLIQVGESRELPAYLVQQSNSSTPENGDSTCDKLDDFDPVAFLDCSIRDIDDKLDGLDLDKLQALKEVEVDGENRKGALEVIDSALLALSIKLAEE